MRQYVLSAKRTLSVFIVAHSCFRWSSLTKNSAADDVISCRIPYANNQVGTGRGKENSCCFVLEVYNIALFRVQKPGII